MVNTDRADEFEVDDRTTLADSMYAVADNGPLLAWWGGVVVIVAFFAWGYFTTTNWMAEHTKRQEAAWDALKDPAIRADYLQARVAVNHDRSEITLRMIDQDYSSASIRQVLELFPPLEALPPVTVEAAPAEKE